MGECNTIGGEVGANIQKIFAYGVRNSFGMAFDPRSGDLWEQENGDDSFSELNRVEPGMNSGWVQIMGPSSRVPQFKEIETSPQFFGLQQIRWPPASIDFAPTDLPSGWARFTGSIGAATWSKAIQRQPFGNAAPNWGTD